MKPVLFSLVAIGLFGALNISCGDPEHDDLVNALGPETNVPTGPLHRPNQPCLACHGGRGPAKSQFSMAGTVNTLEATKTPLAGVVVTLTDSTAFTAKKAGFQSTTNSAGNFFVHKDEYTPAYPVHVQLTHPNAPAGTGPKQMYSHIGRDGSCAGCHKEGGAGTESPGIVYFASSASDLPAAQ